MSQILSLQQEIEDELNKYLDAIELVEQAEATKNLDHYNIAKDAVSKLPNGELKYELNERLNLIKFAIEMSVYEGDELLKREDSEVRKAEIFKRNPYIARANILVELLDEGEVKSEYKARIASYVEQTEKNRFNDLVKKAEQHLGMAEKYKTSTMLRKALDSIMAVPNSEEKRQLLLRFDEIGSIPSKETLKAQELLTFAQRWVSKMENSPSEFALKNARQKVQDLPDSLSAEKAELQQRLDVAIDDYYKERALVYLSKAS